MGSLAKRALRDWVRPPLIPLCRGYVRYFPVQAGKRFMWNHVVGPYLQCADHPFVARTVDGRMIAGNTIDLIQRYIYYFGIWEPALTRWIRKRLRPGDIFVDVGSNIGYYTTLASGLVGERGTVIALEASPKIFEQLKGNLGRNHSRNVQALNIAVSNRKGKVKVFGAPNGNIGETSIIQQEGREFEAEVDADALSSILRGCEKEKVRVVKIDVEGAESLVIDGMRELLAGSPAMDVLVEINPETLKNHDMTPTGIFEIFEKAGYRAYSLKNDYSPLSYLDTDSDDRPTPIRDHVTERVDVLFTRDDLEDVAP